MSDFEQIRKTQREQGDALADLGTSVEFLTGEIKGFREDIRPLVDIYNGGRFARSLLIGIASFVGSLVALGASIWMIINWLKHF